MQIDSIIFDLDGTLWDSTGTLVNVFNNELRGMKEVQKPLTKKELEGAMGLRINEFIQKLFPYINYDVRCKIARIFEDTHCKYVKREGGILYKNLEDTLKAISKKYQLFIVSNCQVGYIEAFLEYNKFNKYFKGFESSGHTGMSKGENIKTVIRRYNLNNPVYVGDTQLDCESAEIAGIPFVYASYGFGEVKKYDYILKDTWDLTNLSI